MNHHSDEICLIVGSNAHPKERAVVVTSDHVGLANSTVVPPKGLHMDAVQSPLLRLDFDMIDSAPMFIIQHFSCIWACEHLLDVAEPFMCFLGMSAKDTHVPIPVEIDVKVQGWEKVEEHPTPAIN